MCGCLSLTVGGHRVTLTVSRVLTFYVCFFCVSVCENAGACACTVCMCEFFRRRRAEASEARTHTQSQRSAAGVELSAGCCSWAPQSPESLLTPGPKEPEVGKVEEGEEEEEKEEEVQSKEWWIKKRGKCIS